jgi:CheY-like chemotaxis protein
MIRVLLVDDEPDIRSLLRDALKLRGYSVDIAADAPEAISLGEKRNYDVAIIDFVLPGMRGLELQQHLRENQPFIRSIIISGQIDHDVLSTTELEGQLKDQVAADRYLPKPVALEDLDRAIREVLTPVSSGDWKILAKDALAGSRVTKSSVKVLEGRLKKAKKAQRKK